MSMRINLTPDEERAVADAYSRTWWLWLIGGILWLLLGFIVLSLRPASITACAILIAIAFWLGGITQLALGFVLEGGWRWLAIIGGALALLAGVVAIVWPEPTLVVISVFVAWYLLIRGLFDVVIALSHTHVRGWWMPLIAGLVGIALGAWAIGNPDRSVLLLVSIIGIWSIFKGVADLMASFEYRRSRQGAGRMSDDTDATNGEPATPDTPDDATESVEAETAAAPVATASAVPADVKVKPDKGKRWQRIVSVVLLVLGFILVPLSAVAIWTHNQLTNTDRYVETVSPLAENADVQQVVAAAVVNAIFTGNIEKRVASALPKRAQPLAAPIASAAKSYATDVTEKLLASQQFSDLWDAANRRAHNQLVALLTDDSSKAPGAVNIKDGKVTLDLTKVITQVQGKLVDAGLSFLKNVNVPPVSRTITIIDTEGLAEARSYVSILDTLAWVLPVLGILCLAGRRSSCRRGAGG